jgi:hypothetical protein
MDHEFDVYGDAIPGLPAPRSIPRLSALDRLLRDRAGIVATHELLAIGVGAVEIEMRTSFARHGRLVRLRKGWYGDPSLPPEVVLAWRFGGPLACVSALVYHGELAREAHESPEPHDSAEPLHVCVRSNTSRTTPPYDVQYYFGGPLHPAPVVHWSTSDRNSGTRRAVSPAVAWAQARQCRAGPPGSQPANHALPPHATTQTA